MGKKSLTQKMLDLLLEGNPPSKIREKYPKRGAALTNAIQGYIEQITPKVQKLQSQIEPLQKQVSVLKDEIDFNGKQLSKTKKRLLEEKKNEDDLQNNLDRLGLEIKEKEILLEKERSAFSEFETNLQELERKGITPELVKQISEMQVETKKDLLERVKTEEAYSQIRNELSVLVEKKKDDEKKIETLRKRLDKLEREINFKKQELDAETMKTKLYRDAVETTQEFLKDGYSISELRNLRSALKAVAIKGDPQQSLSRLLTGLQGVKALYPLENKIEGKKKELEKLLSKISKTKGELNAFKRTFFKSLNEAKNQAIEDIKNSGLHAIKQTENVRQKAEKKIEETGNLSTKTLKDINRRAMNGFEAADIAVKNYIKNMDIQTGDALNRFSTQVSATMKQFKTDFEKWVDLHERASKYAELMTYGYYLFGVLQNPEAVKELPLSIIARLTDRLHTYTEIFFPLDRTNPSPNVNRKELVFSRYQSYSLPALTLWLKEEFEKKTLESVRE